MKFFFPLLTTSLLLFSSIVFSQKQGQAEIDSLVTELRKIKIDTAKVNAWNILSSNYGVINPDSGLIYAKLALQKSKQINWIKGEVISLNNVAASYFRKGTFDKALTFSFESISKNAITPDSLALADSYHIIGQTYMTIDDNDKAFKYIQDELNILQATKNNQGKASAYNAMGIIQNNLENYQEALDYYEMALTSAKEIDDKGIVAYSYSNSGGIYSQLKQFSKALEYQFKALKIEEEMGDIYGMGTEYGSISSAYMGLYDEQKQKNSSYSGALIDSAIYYANKGIEYCKRCNNLFDEAIITFSLSEAYKLKGNYKKALEVYIKGSILNDSIFSSQNQNKIREVESKQQTLLSEKEMQLLQAKKKMERNYYLAAGAFLLLVSIGIFSRLQVIRKTKKKLEEKNRIILIEKKRSDDLLLNILPAEVAEELMAKGSTEAKQFGEVTVMFTDFKGFTQISEKLSPSELVAEIHTCFKAFDNIITKYNIEKIKTIGDAYMCAGGLPVTNKTNAIDVIGAAKEIQQFMQTHKEEREKRGLPVFEIRIGVNTGSVVAGIVGVKKFAYDIWGDTVNIASRMESSGEVGKVNISGTTYELVKDKFSCEYRGKISAKGKGEIDMYFVEESL